MVWTCSCPDARLWVTEQPPGLGWGNRAIGCCIRHSPFWMRLWGPQVTLHFTKVHLGLLARGLADLGEFLSLAVGLDFGSSLGKRPGNVPRRTPEFCRTPRNLFFFAMEHSLCILTLCSQRHPDSPWRPRFAGGTVDSAGALVGRGVELQRHWTTVARQSEWPVGGTCLLFYFFSQLSIRMWC